MKRKFVNKKTGAEARVMAIYLDSDGVIQVDSYDAVEDLMDDYAAYEEYNPPKGPLIKDEKIRKAVRAWAEACGIEKAYLRLENEEGSTFCVYNFSIDCYFIQIATHDQDPIGGGRLYTIAELCGEEEE